MRYLVGLLLLTCTLAAAKERQWHDAIFMGTRSSNAGAAAMPMGTSIVAFPINKRTYWFKSDGITYVLATSYTGHWPNLTVNGHVKFAVDGRNAHVLDEDNKDRKFSIIEKIAEKKD
ncbi:MAG: hypothetical protein JWQ87_2258 [Candidatus Sulfotelmatobacter sp.]|nr:hypothetical protein [Candidatus Sulfotelmatobacter sp.]